MYLSGQRAVNRAISKLGPKISKKALRSGARASAKVFVKELKLRAPRNTGALKKSVKVKSYSKKKIIRLDAIVARQEAKHYYAASIEYGRGPAGWHNEKVKAQPFIRPAFKFKKKAAKKAAIDTIKTETKRLLT